MTSGFVARGRPRPETLEELKAHVRENWKPGAGGAAAALLDRAGEILERGTVPFGGLAEMLGRELDADLLTAVVILSSTSVAVLDVGYVLDEEGAEIPLDPVAVSEANFSKSLAHPETGEPVEDWEGRTYPFVTANGYLRDLLARETGPAPSSAPASAP